MSFCKLLLSSLRRPLVIAMLITTPANPTRAHSGFVNEDTPLVPIPAYSLPHGPAGGLAALRAARAFLDSLDAEAQDQVLLAADAEIRTKWSNLPARFVERGGIKLGELSSAQIELLFEFLASSLGPEGYEAVGETLAAEAFLAQDERAERFQWAPSNYWFAFYGTVSETSLWGWQFGGHHLAINVAIERSAVTSLSPTFVGAEPAIFSYAGLDYEPVRDMHEAGLTIFASLHPEQQARALLPKAPEDVVAGPGQDGHLPAIEGDAVAEWSAEQKKLLLDAVSEWVSMQPKDNAAARMQVIESQLGETFFAWSGEPDGSGETYFRIQGPTLIIELKAMDRVGRIAENRGHFHTIYRNPTCEYGCSTPQTDQDR